ncbi:glycosyltransferase family 2 protein [Duganella callida]|uniref:Glycosyltransferase family 2 protein n=1 Tax=Duganella callida TaxID=2561932 RepID=A0A4Y9S6Q7_9BURK|nr:glycosyltransferase family 2 protein [Duganella callida]TFW17128.1 glycosyltransferase family 2 protein [Duganella callida]
MFTVIVPTHARPLLLRRTLQSLIAQTYQEFQVIVVDDSGAYVPPYAEMAAMPGRYTYIIRSGVNGPAESRNMALDLVRTPYVIFLDDDDTFEPGHLAALAKHIGNGKPELLSCDFSVINEDRTQNPPQFLSRDQVSTAAVTAASVHVINRIPNSCLIYRRDVVEKLRYATDMIIYEDWDFLLAALKGRTLRHVATGGVNIHKSKADAPENMRRGNTRDDLIVQTMLDLYRKHRAPDQATRQARLQLMQQAGVTITLDQC